MRPGELLMSLAHEAQAGLYDGPGLLVFCPDDRTTRDLAIQGGAASVCKSDGRHEAAELVQRGILRILGLGGRVTVTMGAALEGVRLPEGAVGVFHPDCPKSGKLRAGYEAFLEAAKRDPVPVPRLFLCANPEAHSAGIAAGIIPPETQVFNVRRHLREKVSMAGDLVALDMPMPEILLSQKLEEVPVPLIVAVGEVSETQEELIRDLKDNLCHRIIRKALPEDPGPSP